MNGYAEDLRQRLNYEPEPAPRPVYSQSSGSTVAITTNGDVVRTDNIANGGQAAHGVYKKTNKNIILCYCSFFSSVNVGTEIMVLVTSLTN